MLIFLYRHKNIKIKYSGAENSKADLFLMVKLYIASLLQTIRVNNVEHFALFNENTFASKVRITKIFVHCVRFCTPKVVN